MTTFCCTIHSPLQYLIKNIPLIMTTALKTRPSSSVLAKKPYQAAQQVEYVYLEAEIDVLLRQLQNLKSQKAAN